MEVFDYIKFYIEDQQSGIANENNIEVFLDGKKLIVEYNSYRKVVLYKVKEKLEIGKHEIKIKVRDNSKNESYIEGVFYIK